MGLRTQSRLFWFLRLLRHKCEKFIACHILMFTNFSYLIEFITAFVLHARMFLNGFKALRATLSHHSDIDVFSILVCVAPEPKSHDILPRFHLSLLFMQLIDGWSKEQMNGWMEVYFQPQSTLTCQPWCHSVSVVIAHWEFAQKQTCLQ